MVARSSDRPAHVCLGRRRARRARSSASSSPGRRSSRKGKLDRPTEFGMLVKVQEAEGGIVSDIAVDEARADAPLLVPSVELHQKLFGRPPSTVATDRGFYSSRGEHRLIEMGVKHPVLPRPGHRTRDRIAHERQRWFKRGRAWRAGGEARISRLKNTFGHETQPISRARRPRSLYRLGRHSQQPGSDREAPRRSPLILTFSPQAGRRDRNGCVDPTIPAPAQRWARYSRAFCTAV